MDVAVSAITGELVSRFTSFLINKCRVQARLQQKLERLQQLLRRVHTVVEEAEGRHITNSRMLIQFRMLLKAMYRGYHVLDSFKYRPLGEIRAEEEVSSSYALCFATSIIRFSRFTNTTKSRANNHDLDRALESLESLVCNMTEFVMLLGGCERMFCRPYDTYVYIDNFMFGRHVEKQQIVNMLLEKDAPDLGAPTVIPIIGGCRVGKKTLVAHVCNYEMVRSHFSSILHFSGDDALWRIMNSEKFKCDRTLIVIELVSDVEDEDWAKFYLSVTRAGRGSKMIIISRLERLARFGTIHPIHLNNLSHEEYSYLFKVLAFGSANPEDHPQLALIANELTLLGGTLVFANIFTNILRNNLNVQFWLHILKKYQNVVKDNFSMFGEHPTHLLGKDRPIDITSYVSSSCDAPLRLMPPYHDSKRELPKLMFGDLIVGSPVLPKGEFELVAWESRIPPYTKFINLATYAEEKHQRAASPSRKRQRMEK